MEHNESHKRDLKVQIREAFGRVVYTYTTHLKQAEFLVKKNKRIKIWQIFLSAISTGGFLGAIASDEVVMTWVAGIVSTILLAIAAATTRSVRSWSQFRCDHKIYL